MKASILIVNYNYARFLKQAIESALAQTYHDTEVIVIDDGSTDDSAEVIRSYGNLIVPVFKNNGGQSSCYTHGLAVSSGDLVLYLDADDYLHSRCLSEVIENWKEGCVKAHFYLDVVDERGARMDAVVPQWSFGQGDESVEDDAPFRRLLLASRQRKYIHSGFAQQDCAESRYHFPSAESC